MCVTEDDLMNLTFQECSKYSKESISEYLNGNNLSHRWMYDSLYVLVKDIPATVKFLEEFNLS